MKNSISVKRLVKLLKASTCVIVNDDYLAYPQIRDDSDGTFMVIVDDACPTNYELFNYDCEPYIQNGSIYLKDHILGEEYKLTLLNKMKL